MNDDLILSAMARLEAKLDGLDEKLDAYSPRVALLEHRVTQLETAGAQRKEHGWQAKLAIAVACLSLVGAFIVPLIGG